MTHLLPSRRQFVMGCLAATFATALAGPSFAQTTDQSNITATRLARALLEGCSHAAATLHRDDEKSFGEDIFAYEYARQTLENYLPLPLLVTVDQLIKSKRPEEIEAGKQLARGYQIACDCLVTQETGSDDPSLSKPIACLKKDAEVRSPTFEDAYAFLEKRYKNAQPCGTKRLPVVLKHIVDVNPTIFGNSPLGHAVNQPIATAAQTR